LTQNAGSGEFFHLTRENADLVSKSITVEAAPVKSKRTRIGDEFGILDGPVFFKPKGMHQKTFDRLRAGETCFREILLWGMKANSGLNPDL